MAKRRQQDVPNYLITLDASVDISRAEALYSLLEQALHSDYNVDIDASGVERVDTTGFQMIVAFRKALEKLERRVFLLSPSDIFIKNAKLLGLDPHLPALKSAQR